MLTDKILFQILFLHHKRFADEFKSVNDSCDQDQSNRSTCDTEIKKDIEDTIAPSLIHDVPNSANVKTHEIEITGELI